MQTHMTKQACRTLLIHATPERIWQLYDDPGELAAWAPNVTAARVNGGGRKELGAQLQTRLKLGPIEQCLEERVTRYEPPRRCTSSGSQPGWQYDISLDLERQGRATLASYRCVSRYVLLLLPFVPLLEHMNRVMIGDALAALKRAAEADARFS
jgi:carbon monoxide dehydrogenase subunit G